MSLSSLGYIYVPGASGARSDFVLRQSDKPNEGFTWKGQENYDAVGAAAVAWVQCQLTAQFGLETVHLSNSVAYASPCLSQHRGPTMLLICGSAPGGAAGVWGRSLIMNQTTHEGAMFDFILRAQSRGWAVVVANPHDDSKSPHRHLTELYHALLAPRAAAQPLLVVAHSYGAALTMGLLKSAPEAAVQLAALALTDGMVWTADGWSGEGLLHEEVPTAAQLDAAIAAKKGTDTELSSFAELAAQSFREELARSSEVAPAAFAPPSRALQARVAALGRNWVVSELPVGSRVSLGRHSVAALMPTVSAGATAHPSTTFAARDDIFAFLDRAVRTSLRRARPED